MTVSELVSLFYSRSAALMAVRGFSATVSFGLIAFVAAAPDAASNRAVTGFLVGGAALMSLGNLVTTRQVLRQREAIRELIEQADGALPAELFDRGSQQEIIGVQVALDALVIAAVFVIPRVL